MTARKAISRRAALTRLGLGAASAYIAPSLVGLSTARAASSPSEPSPASDPTPPSDPSPASAATAPSAPNPSGPSTGPARTNGNGKSGNSSRASGPSGPGSCRQSSLPNGGQITRRDYEKAQRAISRGDARPLRDVVKTVQSRHPGRILRVGFSENGRASSFQVKIVDRKGAIVSVTVDARSGTITRVQNC